MKRFINSASSALLWVAAFLLGVLANLFLILSRSAHFADEVCSGFMNEEAEL